MEVSFLRHGPTANNLTGQINGRRDEPLSPAGRELLRELAARYPYPTPQALYTSPARRCLETAAILFPGLEPRPVEALWECSFGRWEGRTMAQARDLPVYAKWLAADPDCRFPGGESLLECALRAQIGLTQAFQESWDLGYTHIAVVAHGALYRALFRRSLVHSLPPEELDLIPNGMGLQAEVTPETWYARQTFRFTRFVPSGAPRTQGADSPYLRRQ